MSQSSPSPPETRYMLVKGSASGGLKAFVEGAAVEPIGALDSIKSSISRLFPSVRWEKGPELPPWLDLPTAKNISSWYGLEGPAEFELTVGSNEVHMIFMSHFERADVDRVANEFRLVVHDEQTMNQFGG